MLEGLDVSHHNGKIDWQKVWGAGYSFAFCKASQGNTFRDPTFQRNIDEGQRAGLLMGAYHFADPIKPALEQVDLFLDQLKKVSRPLLVAVDLEWMGGTPEPWGELYWQDRAHHINTILDTLMVTLRKHPFIYTNSFFANEYLQGIPLGLFPLWLARYSAAVPAGWREYKIWQFTEKGDVPGVPSPGDDRNRSPLTLEQLTSLAVPA